MDPVASVILSGSVATSATFLYMIAKEPSHSTDLPRRLLRFLEDADEAYMQIFSRRSVGVFCKYACESLCRALSEEVQHPVEREFGSAKYRTRDWEILHDNCDFIRVLKIVKHTPIAFSKTISTGLADDYSEIWELVKINGNYTIQSIEEDI